MLFSEIIKIGLKKGNKTNIVFVVCRGFLLTLVVVFSLYTAACLLDLLSSSSFNWFYLLPLLMSCCRGFCWYLWLFSLSVHSRMFTWSAVAAVAAVAAIGFCCYFSHCLSVLCLQSLFLIIYVCIVKYYVLCCSLILLLFCCVVDGVCGAAVDAAVCWCRWQMSSMMRFAYLSVESWGSVRSCTGI